MKIPTLGNYKSLNIVENEVITRPNPISIPVFPPISLYPTGIDVRFDNPMNTDNAQIWFNRVDHNSIGGPGISLMNSGRRTNVNYNRIFNINQNTNSPAAGWSPATFSGIRIQEGTGTVVKENIVRGQANFPSLFPGGYTQPIIANRSTRGIEILDSKKLTLGCNYLEDVQYGFYVRGNCATSSQQVTRNEFRLNHRSMYFTRSGPDPGTLGDIGLTSFDNENQFLTPPPSGTYKMMRFSPSACLAGTPNLFNDLSQPSPVFFNESVSNVAGCEYQVQNINSYSVPPICSDVWQYPEAPQAPPAPPIEEGEAPFTNTDGEPIAEDSVLYLAYQEVADWMDESRLYEVLAEDNILRNANTKYLTFYNAKDNSVMETIAEFNTALEALNDSVIYTDSIAWINQWNTAWGINAGISSSKSYITNERSINKLYLTHLRYGPDSLDAADSALISTIAFQCPYLVGNASNRARLLNNNYFPAYLYDDKAICNAVGVYKTQKREDDGIIAHNAELAFGTIDIFPNPSTGLINLKYSITQDVEIVFVNALGKQLDALMLDKNNNYAHKQLNLPAGMYIWKAVQGKNRIQTGKLVIK